MAESLIVVGTNSYITLADAEDYFDLHLNPGLWSTSTDTVKEKALIQATKKIDRLNLRGYKVDEYNQTLQFPRIYQYTPKQDLGLDTDDVPQSVLDAVCEEALALITKLTNTSTGLREELQAQGVKSISFGDASETYSTSRVTNQTKLLSQEAKTLLRPYIQSIITVGDECYE